MRQRKQYLNFWLIPIVVVLMGWAIMFKAEKISEEKEQAEHNMSGFVIR